MAKVHAYLNFNGDVTKLLIFIKKYSTLKDREHTFTMIFLQNQINHHYLKMQGAR